MPARQGVTRGLAEEPLPFGHDQGKLLFRGDWITALQVNPSLFVPQSQDFPVFHAEPERLALGNDRIHEKIHGRPDQPRGDQVPAREPGQFQSAMITLMSASEMPPSSVVSRHSTACGTTEFQIGQLTR